MKNEIIIQTQKELIALLTTQVVDLSMMSKIELGDDVIAEWRRLNLILGKYTITVKPNN
tara:strand:- start:443 stop:619 length:177 start_codon:yes stop_codon:yes gene_type:complete